MWWAHLFLLMPDHCHALLSFASGQAGLPSAVRTWKRWTNRHLSIPWQRDFFDHRLRHEESVREKADYILANPVRAGLINEGQRWPHVWMPEQGFLHISR
jgi:putative transposase